MQPTGHGGRNDQYQTSGNAGMTGTGTHTGPAPNTAGPHRQDILNKLDPTVDAQHGGTQVLGPGINSSSQGQAPTHSSTATRSHNTTSGGHGGPFQGQSGMSHTQGAQHSSHMANEVDPRVDSNRVHGTSGGGSAFSGQTVTNQNYPPQHNFRMANEVDPRTETYNTRDTAMSGSGHTGMGHQTGGQTDMSHQSGPQHGSHMANVLDPRTKTSNTSDSGPQSTGPVGTGHHTGQQHGGMDYNTHQHQQQQGPGYGSEQRTDMGHSTGPQHGSHMANVLDPRADSSGNRNVGHTSDSRTGTDYSSGQQNTGMGYNSGMQQSGPGYGSEQRTDMGHSAGPQHNSRMANVLDPRTDSSNTAGSGPTSGHQTGMGGMGGNHDNYDSYGQQQHSSRLANEVDPRTNTSHTGQQQGQMGGSSAFPTGSSGNTIGGSQYPHDTHHSQGTHNTQGSNVQHSSQFANTVDPRVDSQAHNTSHAPMQQGHSTTIHQGPQILPGPASKTAGPHKSNLLNKLDPSVDSKATVTEQREYRTS